MSNMHITVDDLLHENRLFAPPPQFSKTAIVRDSSLYESARADPLAYWESCAERLDWYKRWDKVLDWKPPFAKWYVNGQLNACYNCLDRHIENGLGERVALIWEGEPGETLTLTYTEIYQQVNRLSNVLKSLGINKGDRVAIYMPMIPEAVYAMLACARIGAIHTVVFGGFSAESLKERVQDATARLLITADGGYRRGRIVPLKQTSDDAAADCPSIEHILVVRRTNNLVSMRPTRDVWYHELMENADDYCKPEAMNAEDILFILYTSGTTGKPKGIVHTTGGYLTNAVTTTKLVFDLQDKDIFWCTADVGWITGHTYIVYGPMANGATQVIYEGTPDYPQRDRFWRIVEKHKVSIFYTAPTAIRTFMKWGTEWPEDCDLSSLRLLGSVGEPINPEAWMWYRDHIGHERCPIVDTWWQTETGGIMISPLPGITDTKPGSATVPLPGVDAQVLSEEGTEIEQGGGYLAIHSPWPSMLRGIWGDSERYTRTYWSKWKNIYFTGDGVKRDADGYLWLLGRVDDIMLVAGHNISTMEVESALVDHQMVAEAAVVGISDEIKGQAIAAFVILREGHDASVDAQEELRQHVVEKIGPVARPKRILFSIDLPKTRSGKIMRRLLRDIAENKTVGDVTTLADPSIIEKLKQQYEEA